MLAEGFHFISDTLNLQAAILNFNQFLKCVRYCTFQRGFKEEATFLGSLNVKLDHFSSKWRWKAVGCLRARGSFLEGLSLSDPGNGIASYIPENVNVFKIV